MDGGKVGEGEEDERVGCECRCEVEIRCRVQEGRRRSDVGWKIDMG